MEYTCLYPVPVLPILLVGLTPHRIADPGGRHQVTFIGGIDKHITGIAVPIQRTNGTDGTLPHGDTLLPVEEFFPVNRDLILPDKLFEYLFSGMGLKDPHGPEVTINGDIALTGIAIFAPLLPSPGSIILVMKPEPVVKIPCQSTDHSLISRIGPPQSGRGKSSEMFIGRDENHLLSHFCHLYRGNHCRRISPVDDHICRKLIARGRFFPIFTGGCKEGHNEQHAAGRKEFFDIHDGFDKDCAEIKKICTNLKSYEESILHLPVVTAVLRLQHTAWSNGSQPAQYHPGDDGRPGLRGPRA